MDYPLGGKSGLIDRVATIRDCERLPNIGSVLRQVSERHYTADFAEASHDSFRDLSRIEVIHPHFGQSTQCGAQIRLDEAFRLGGKLLLRPDIG